MDDRRFDALTKRLAARVSRRGAIKGLLGLGSAAAVVSVLGETAPTEAQRRPTPTTRPQECPGNQVPCGNACCCPSGSTACGSDCCPNGQAACCDGACCYGTCFDEGICCAPGQRACNGACIPTRMCCADSECVEGRCVNGSCLPYTPTSAPTNTTIPTDTPAPSQTSVPTQTSVPATSTPTPTRTVQPTLTPMCQVDNDCGPRTCGDGGRRVLYGACVSGHCVGTSLICPVATTCVTGQCVAVTATATPTSTPTTTPTSTPPGMWFNAWADKNTPYGQCGLRIRLNGAPPNTPLTFEIRSSAWNLSDTGDGTTDAAGTWTWNSSQSALIYYIWPGGLFWVTVRINGQRVDDTVWVSRNCVAS